MVASERVTYADIVPGDVVSRDGNLWAEILTVHKTRKGRIVGLTTTGMSLYVKPASTQILRRAR